MDERDKRHRGKNNPYPDESISPSESIRREARGDINTHPVDKTGDRQAESTAALRAAEDSASIEPDSTTDVKSREESTSTPTSSFVNKVTGDEKKKSGIGAMFKKYRTVMLIMAILGLGGGGILVAQSTLGYNLVSRMLDEANPQFITNHLRAPTVFRYAVEKNKLSDAQKEELKKHGIEVVEKKGKKNKVRFMDDTGKIHTVSVRKAFKNKSFRIKWDGASQNFAGQYAGQHDSLAIKLRKIYGISFDNWHDWRNDTKGDDAKMKRAKFRNILKEKVVSKFSSGASRSKGENQEGEEGSDNKGEVTAKDSRKKIKTTLKGVVSAAFTGAAMGKCGEFAINVALNTYTMGISISNSFAVASTLLEAIQKAEAGDGTEAPIHEALDSISEVNEKTGTSALEDTGLGYLFSGGKGEIHSGVEDNLEGLFIAGKQTIADFTSCAMLSSAASMGNLVLSVFSGGVGGTAKKVVTKALISFGAQAAVGIFAEKAIEAYINNATDAIKREFDVSNSLSGKTYGANLYTGGIEILGRTAQAGGSSYLNTEMVKQYEEDKQAVFNDQAEYERATKSPFDTSSRYTFLGSLVNNSLFPFATSVSTSSIGNILSQSSTVLSNSIVSMLPSANAIGATHALTAQDECPIANSVDAVGYPHCPTYRGTDTSTIDDECDQKCVIETIMDKYDAFEEDDFTLTPTIKENSNLARYQKYCGLRGSQVGLFDGDITSQIDEENGGTDLASAVADNTILSLLPFIGDIAEIVKNINESSKSQWIDGSACVAGNENWGEYKWYQRFLEDQRLMVNMGITDKSSGEQFVTAYLEKHPIDNSREGMIARLSGLSKDTVIAIEDQIFYDSYLADEYHPENLGPVFHDDSYEKPPLNLTTRTPTSHVDNTEALAALERIVYAPLQSRAAIV